MRFLRRLIGAVSRSDVERILAERMGPSAEQSARSVIRPAANDMDTTAQALLIAAEHLKDAGKGVHASRAHQAGQKAKALAAEWRNA